MVHGFVVECGGDFLTWSAGDFKDWMAERPDTTEREGWREEHTAVTRHLLAAGWSIRIHATYDEAMGNIMDVFEVAHQAELAHGRAGFA